MDVRHLQVSFSGSKPEEIHGACRSTNIKHGISLHCVTIRTTSDKDYALYAKNIDIQHFRCDFKGLGQKVRAHSDYKSLKNLQVQCHFPFHSYGLLR
jgi:hypothetical protein